jgi:glycosidase
MQWTAERNGGFSSARSSKLPTAVVGDGFSPTHVNVADQRHDPDSLLHFIRRLIQRYRASAEIGWGEFRVLKQPNNAVLAHIVSGDEGLMLAAHNFSPDPTTITVSIDGVSQPTRLVDLLRDDSAVTDETGRLQLSLEGYGFRWLRIVSPGEKRLF